MGLVKRVWVVVLVVVWSALFSSAPGRAWAEDAVEDAHRFCPVVSPELQHLIAKELKDDEQCDTQCRGCGCKGGPGYREVTTDRCVGWRDLIEKCGPPPHSLCKAECEPVVAGCIGRAWIKQIAKEGRLNLNFVEGQERPKKAKEGR